MKYLQIWWDSIDRLNFILIIALGFTGLILSFSMNEIFSINRHSIFFLISSLLLIFLSNINDKNIRRISFLGFILLLILIRINFISIKVIFSLKI